MELSKSIFGEREGNTVFLYNLKNNNGMEVSIMNYGATITSLKVPDSKGEKVDVVCGFDSLAGYFSKAYLENAPYFGCTVGRYAGRIGGGKFQISGKQYQLPLNNGENHLHGGVQGFDKKIWSAEPIKSENSIGVKMQLFSPDMEEGYPGNLSVAVTFSLDNTNALTIQYSAKTDQETPLTLTNHSYFNLSGFKTDIKEHSISIQSDSYLTQNTVDSTKWDLIEVEHSSSDLRNEVRLGDCLSEMATGFEHYYIFQKADLPLPEIACFSDPVSGRKLEVFSNEPGMLFYTGFFTSDQLSRENGDQYGSFRAFCCETSRYPNGPNILESPKSILKQSDEFDSQTVFKFSW